ncbi:hypothetical protein GGI20_000726 [Coemansia sp. BCRC 34301]|nr:hypothetical protein GGI20_000726 [Coemansia sp. BCRC 34301]
MLKSGQKATAALDSTVVYTKKDRSTAHGGLVRWFDYCSQNSEFNDGVCNAARLRVYASHAIEQAEAKVSSNQRSIFSSFYLNMSPLWVVWVHSDMDSDRARKDAFEFEYDKVKKEVKQRLEQKYASTLRTTAVQTPLSPRETPDLSNLAISDTASEPILQGASFAATRAAVPIQRHFTNANGEDRSFDGLPMEHGWKVFSYESDTFLHSLLLRRSSQCSLQMRLWHALSVSTWLDADSLCKGITLGSLSTRAKQLSASATVNVNAITIQTKRTNTGVSRSCSSGATDRKELRNSRSASEGGQCKVDLLRHRRILQCPWNALAVFLFHKWHVLNEPPPDFSNSAWMSEPLFQDGAALCDAHLLDFCDGHYREYQSEFEKGNQAYKSISQRTYTAMGTALNSSRMLKGTVSSSRTLLATQRVLQNGVYDEALVSIAGFSTDSRAQPYHISRQHNNTLFAGLEETIFPFADYIPDFTKSGHSDIDGNQRQATVGFCNMLKLLRTALLQDAALLLYTPFYRQMLMHSSVFGSPIFLSDTFRDKADICGEALMAADCMPMYATMPQDTRLGKVRPALAGNAAHPLASPRPGGGVGGCRLSRQGQASGSVEPLSDPPSGAAKQQHMSAEPGEDRNTSRLTQLQRLNERLEVDSPELSGGAADTPTTESDEEARLRRMNLMRQLQEEVDDTLVSKRRRIETADFEPAPLRAQRMSFGQRTPDSGLQRRSPITSPSASIYLVEDEDGNFVDGLRSNSVFTQPLSHQQGVVEASTDPLDKRRDLQVLSLDDGDPSSPMAWEATSFEFISDGVLSSHTPDSISDSAVPELDFTEAAPALPGAIPLLESGRNDMANDVEAPLAPGHTLSTEPAVALAQAVHKVCQAQRLLLDPGFKIQKLMFAIHTSVNRVVTLRAESACMLARGGVVSSHAVERMRDLGILLVRAKIALAKLWEVVRSNSDLLGEPTGDGVERALGCAFALLSPPAGRDTSHR